MFSPVLCIIGFTLLFIVSRGNFASLSLHERAPGDNMNVNPLTSHILDTSRGTPAAGVLVKLYKRGDDGNWNFVIEQLTNSDGRVGNLISGQQFSPSIYKLHFDTKSYYAAKGEKTFYPYVEVVFEIEKPEEHYHVPILLNAYGYSTYRGS